MLKPIRLSLNPLLLLVLSSVTGYTQQPAATEEFVPAHYTKYEFRIPMRDGKRLFTSVYVPKTGAFADKGPYPFLMDRTPYSVAPYGEDRYPKNLGPSDERSKSTRLNSSHGGISRMPSSA